MIRITKKEMKMNDDEHFEIEVNGRKVAVTGQAVSVDEVLALSGVGDAGILIRIDGGRSAHLVQGASVRLERGVRPAFRTFHGATVRHLRVSGLVWDWGDPAITETEIRTIGGIGDDVDLVRDGGDEPLRRGSVVDLTTPWPPHIEARDVAPERSSVPVVINGRQVLLDRPDVTFEDLVGLAFPGTDLVSASSRALTVTYRQGPPDRPEGSLLSREAIRARRGEVFNVSATNKS
jgi:hypothetical protein